MMKKHLLILLLSIGIHASTFAQKITSGDYKITISDLKSNKYTAEDYGEKHDFIEYSGNYVIEKKGEEIARQKFTTLQIDKSSFTLNIKQDEISGNSLFYDFETKNYEFMGEEHAIKKHKTVEDLILSGFVVYLKMFEEE